MKLMATNNKSKTIVVVITISESPLSMMKLFSYIEGAHEVNH